MSLQTPTESTPPPHAPVLADDGGVPAGLTTISIAIGLVLIVGCISSELIMSKMKSLDWVNLSIEKDQQNEVYRLRDNLDGKEYGEFGGPHCRQQGMPGRPKAADASGNLLEWMARTFGISALAQGSTPSIPDLIKALEAESSDIRAGARDQLGRLRDPASLKLMTASWDIDKSSYRADLGRLVAWTNATRQDRDTAARIATSLSPEQLGYVVRLTGHADKTMRYNATEVLSWMLQSTGWPNAPAPDTTKTILSEVTNVFAGPDAIKLNKPGSEFDFANTAFNTLVAVDDAKCVLTPDARQSISTALAPFESKYIKDLPKTVSMSQGIRTTLAKPGC